jgi:hypothetical protein
LAHAAGSREFIPNPEETPGGSAAILKTRQGTGCNSRTGPPR